MVTENQPNSDDFAGTGTFQEKTVPADTRLAGWAALVHTFAVQAPVRQPSAVSRQHVKASRREAGGWKVFDKRYWPGESFGGQMGFALHHEDLDLLVLKRLFQAVPQDTVAAFVRSAPTGSKTRILFSAFAANRSIYLQNTCSGKVWQIRSLGLQPWGRDSSSALR